MGIREGGVGPWPDLEGRAGIEARGARPEVPAGMSGVSPLPVFIATFDRRALGLPGRGELGALAGRGVCAQAAVVFLGWDGDSCCWGPSQHPWAPTGASCLRW